jgi:AraC-like DNA-binding protein
MKLPEPFRPKAWLESPLRTSAGEIQLAGTLQNVRGIDPKAMRVLGSYGLVYMVDVDGFYGDANGTRLDLANGDLVVIFPELAHAYGPKHGRTWSQIYFVVNGPQFDFWRERGLLSPGRPVWHLEPVDYWRHRMEEIVAPEAGHTVPAAMRAFGRFLDLVCDMLAAQAESATGPGGNTWLEESQRLLGAPSGHGWLTPQQAAREVGLSYDNFRKQFTARLGASPGQFQKRRRIDRACSAIYQGERTFKQLAEELEFCDVFHFSKAFKQIVGVTPSEFRRKVRGR